MVGLVIGDLSLVKRKSSNELDEEVASPGRKRQTFLHFKTSARGHWPGCGVLCPLSDCLAIVEPELDVSFGLGADVGGFWGVF